ncbi:sigma-70 family RNA polymerase sigma factor [Asticcacaulis solisilvae]|uniref:sigma-70 family RNA polymerase sigma factor n=1 Tax=Asticcacaulis solisilvae TaxID=1217274 RepID=UPI003FD85E8A
MAASDNIAASPQALPEDWPENRPENRPEDQDEGEAALWREFTASGSAAARRKLFDLHHTFARQIAARHFLDRKSGDIEFADLCQLAYTGLLEALDRYDPERGVGFRPFARRRISGSILDGLSHMSELREQLSYRRRVRAERLKSLTVEKPEVLEAPAAMAALIEMATGLALGFMLEGSGLYMDEDAADTRASPYDSLAWKQLIGALKDEVSKLPPQQTLVITYHYLNGLSFDQISKIMELSKGRISQIHRSSLTTLRERLYSGGGFIFEK